MIIINDVIQGTPEWDLLRCGVASASNFDKIITTKGEPSKQAKKYMYELAAERITMKKEPSYSNAHMERGKEKEDEARKLYEMISGEKVVQVGFVYKDESKTVGCSPDGLVGDFGGIEIKSACYAVQVERLLEQKLSTEYIQQVQGNMYVTGRDWWDFVSYCEGLNPLIVRVERDERFIGMLDFELKKFLSELEEITERIR